MDGIKLEGLPCRYQYLTQFNKNNDKVLDEKDNPNFKDVKSPEEAERIILSNTQTTLPVIADLATEACTVRTVLPQGYKELSTEIALPEGYKELKIERAVDGDTYKINVDFDGKGGNDSIRVADVNTTEFGKGRYLDSRIEKAEPGAVAAWERLTQLLAKAENRVYIDPFTRRDGYKRILSLTFIKTEKGYEDLSAILIREGMGHAFFFTVENKQQYSCYLLLQEMAKLEKLGIWSLSDSQDPTDPDGYKDIHITSFHSDATKEGNEEEPLYNEYLRITNVDDQPIDLANFRIFNKVSKKTVPLPHFIVPPGRMVKIATGNISTNSEPEKELVLSLGMNKPFWENKEEGGACLVIQTRDGKKVVDFSAKYGYRDCP